MEGYFVIYRRIVPGVPEDQLKLDWAIVGPENAAGDVIDNGGKAVAEVAWDSAKAIVCKIDSPDVGHTLDDDTLAEMRALGDWRAQEQAQREERGE